MGIQPDMREDGIANAIRDLPPGKFEEFARELVRRELYRGLNPTSETYDFGEDARTEPSTVHIHAGKWISVAVSKTTSLAKIRADCEKLKQAGRPVDVVVYVTVDDLRGDTEAKWQSQIKGDFGWDLEVRSTRWLAPTASQALYEGLVDDYLHIPPPGGDYVGAIEAAFGDHTARESERIQDTIPGLQEPLPRSEITSVEEQLASRGAVLLTGEAGTGKSAIGLALAKSALSSGKAVLLLDARSVAHIQTEGGLRQYLGLSGAVHMALGRAARVKGCRLIIDQLDNVAGLPSAILLVNLGLDARKSPGGVEVVVVSRAEETHERSLLKDLVAGGFISLSTGMLGEATVVEVFERLGITHYSDEAVQLGRNLLNLELIARIQSEEQNCDFSTITDEVYLWERYLDTLGDVQGDAEGEEVIAEATRLARKALGSVEGTVELPYPLSRALQRAISWGLIVPVEGRIYRFRHERFQEFIYAWDSCQRLSMPGDVLRDILPYRSESVFRWMEALYRRQGSPAREQFLREVFDVKH